MLNIENLKRYLLEGLAIALVTSVLPKKKLIWYEVASIVLVSALTIFILDAAAPEVSASFRQGAGFGIGAKHVGFGEGFENEDEGEPSVDNFHCGNCPGDHKKSKEGFDYGGAKYSDEQEFETFENRNRDFRVIENFSADNDFKTLEKFNQEELDDNDDDDLDNIEGFFREEFSNKGLKEGFVGANLSEAFQDFYAFNLEGSATKSGRRPNTTGEGGQTAAERGLVYGNIIGGDHSAKLQDICYSGDLINIRTEMDGYVRSPEKEVGSSIVSRDVVVGQNNSPRLDKLRIVLNKFKRDFSILRLVNLGLTGDEVSFVHNDKEKDKYLAAKNGNIVSHFVPKKDDTNHLFRIHEVDAGDQDTVLNFGTPIKIQYAGMNAEPGSGSFLVHDPTSGRIAYSADINSATTFLLTRCEIGCLGPLWRFSSESVREESGIKAQSDYELDSSTLTSD